MVKLDRMYEGTQRGTMHQWGPDDVCKVCRLRRDGYAGGRTGQLVYTDVNGVRRLRAGYCALPRCEHGAALRDWSGERLEPACGCRSSA